MRDPDAQRRRVARAMRDLDVAAFLIDAVPRNGTASALASIAETTTPAYRAFLDAVRKRFGVAAFAPWDHRFVLNEIEKAIDARCSNVFQVERMEGVLRQTLQDFGFKDEALRLIYQSGPYAKPPFLETAAIHMLVTRRPGAAPFGKTDDVPPSAVCQITASDGLRSYRVLMHECGHAVHFRSIQSPYDSLRLVMDRWFKESIAKVFETIVGVQVWLTGQMGLDPKIAQELRELRSLQQVVVFRQNIVIALVEMLIPELPEAGLSEVLWSVLAKQILYPDLKELDAGLRDHERRMMFQENNALDAVLSDVTAAAIRKRLSTNLTAQSSASDGWYSSQGGSKLIPFIRAAGHNWKEAVERELGYPWDAKPIAEELETAIGRLS